jgi:hypothetical protein
VTQLYPRALGSLFVASYDSQGYGGAIPTRLYTNFLDITHRPVFYLKLSFVGLSVPHRKHISLLYEPNRLMLFIGLCRWYINATFTILDIIHSSVLKNDVSGIGFCLNFQVEPIQLGPKDRASLCLQTGLETKNVDCEMSCPK